MEGCVSLYSFEIIPENGYCSSCLSWQTLLPGRQTSNFFIICFFCYKQTFVKISFANTFSNLSKYVIKEIIYAQKWAIFMPRWYNKCLRTGTIFYVRICVIYQNEAYLFTSMLIYYLKYLWKNCKHYMTRYGGVCGFVLP